LDSLIQLAEVKTQGYNEGLGLCPSGMQWHSPVRRSGMKLSRSWKDFNSQMSRAMSKVPRSWLTTTK